MILDNSFMFDVKKIANGNGSREAKFKFLNAAKDAARAMSNEKIGCNFANILKVYGRATVGVCVAATVVDRWDRLEPSTVQWAREVLKLWTNRPPEIGCIKIRDGLHPCKIEEYAGSLIRLTTDTP